jgi:N6-L-threonylcarbamoyladenine synthase
MRGTRASSTIKHSAPSDPMHRILGIETSCDETSVSVVAARWDNNAEPNWGLLPKVTPQHIAVQAHFVHSQTSLHEPFGGVVPEVAARDHLARLPDLAAEALSAAKIQVSDLSGIAVTFGPGLIGAVMVGCLFAQGLSEASGVPLWAINHVDAHLAPATLLDQFDPKSDLNRWLPVRRALFPRISLTTSGGHCLLSLDASANERTFIGSTLDDACGEAFDKVAKLLGFPYPGGPHIERSAAKGNPSTHRFAQPLSGQEGFNFSFSGLKTAVLRTVQSVHNGTSMDEQTRADIAASFQEAALEHLIQRTVAAVRSFPEARELVVAGGVAANQRFRKALTEASSVPVHFAPVSLCGDNGTMIALQALIAQRSAWGVHPHARYYGAQKIKARVES